MFPFSNPTNKATRPLPPGYYKIWIEKGKKQVDSRIVEIGAAGMRTETIVFTID